MVDIHDQGGGTTLLIDDQDEDHTYMPTKGLIDPKDSKENLKLQGN